jgi:hypothetical protein
MLTSIKQTCSGIIDSNTFKLVCLRFKFASVRGRFCNNFSYLSWTDRMKPSLQFLHLKFIVLEGSPRFQILQDIWKIENFDTY